jgi:hypothetical protein
LFSQATAVLFHLLGCRYWYTSRHQRILDYELSVQGNKMLDADGDVVYTIPSSDNYTGWAGYNE